MTLSTRCTCWILQRADGVRMGFTDHDLTLQIEGVSCEAVAALDASEARSTLGLGTDAQDVAGALDSRFLTEEDIAAGRYDGADIEIWDVDWREPDARTLVRRATLGEITRTDGTFTAELRGLAHILQQTDTRRFTRTCDAALGDERCGVALGPFTLTGPVSLIDGAVLECEVAADRPDDWLAHGSVTFEDGANVGVTIEIASHRGSRLHLWREPPFAVEPGSSVRLVAGCDKSFATCRAKFANSLSFRGYPHMPGGDFTLGYAKTGELHDGGALVGEASGDGVPAA